MLPERKEQVKSENRSIPDRLILAYLAEQDFSTAIKLLKDVKNSPFDEDDFALRVAQAQVQSGRVPVHQPQYFLDKAQKTKKWSGLDSMYKQVALLQADMGDFSQALTTAKKTHPTSDFYMEIAVRMAKHKIDPNPVLEKAISQEKDKPTAIFSNVKIAQTQLSLGIDPKALLDSSRQLTKKSKYTSDYDRIELARGYALCGFPDEALDVLGEIENQRESKIKEPKILAYIAIAKAKKGDNPLSVNLGNIDPLPFHEQAEIYALLSWAYSEYGLDPQPMIDCAVQKAVQEPPDSFRVDAFIAIAEAQIENGDDAKSTLVQALDSADHITEAKEFSKDETGFALQVIAWEDIAFTQIRAGYFDDARLTMERLNIDINPDYLLSKVWTLTELAKTEAQAGLSLEEIKKMSQLDVQAIIGGDNELAKQALTFFKIEFMI